LRGWLLREARKMREDLTRPPAVTIGIGHFAGSHKCASASFSEAHGQRGTASGRLFTSIRPKHGEFETGQFLSIQVHRECGFPV
jgi:hypothetical protein